MQNQKILGIILLLCVYFAFSCSGKKEHDHEHGTGTHTHEENEVHEHGPGTHTHDEAEEQKHGSAPHTHEESEDHKHGTGTHTHEEDEDPGLFSLADESTINDSEPHTHADGTVHSEHDHAGEGKTAQVTFRSDRFEIFLEHPFIVANKPVIFVTHVTDMVTLMPRRAGSVTFVLRQGSETPIEHIEPNPKRAGIYLPNLTFSQTGLWTVSLSIPLEGKEHRIDLPSFTVYGSDAEVDQAPAPDEISGISFLKEQQWQIPSRIEPVQKRKILAQEALVIPESAVVDEGEKPVVFVQVAGETFEKRHPELGVRDNGIVQVLSGLSEGEYVVTKGAAAILLAESAGPDHQSHVHGDGTVHTDEAHTDDNVNAEGRSYHVHGDGSVHYSEASESRVVGNIVKIPANEMIKYGIGVSTAGPGKLQIKIPLSGEIAINTDNMAHIVPRVPGIVREVKARLGDIVKKGEVIAVINSRELADAKADYLANLERLNLAQANFDRKEKLWQDKISPEKEYLYSRQNLAEAKINLRTAKQKLIAMGFTSAYLESLPEEADEAFTRFEVVAPFNGTVIEKHIALGENLKDDVEVFVIADLNTVWINLQVYPNELSLVRKGQRISLQDNVGVPETHGIIDYVGPVVGTQTRTALARAVQPNPNGELRPGLFVNADVTVKKVDANILVHKDHIQYLNDVPCVFIKIAQGFELRGVILGDSDGEYVAITKGLKAGESYATSNSFLLKSEMEQSPTGVHVHADGTVH
jgi:membrane fusion protein, heavy metal efflux system